MAGPEGVTYTNVSDIYDDVVLEIDKDGSFTLSMPEGRKGLIPKWEDFGSDSPGAYRPAIPAFNVTGKLKTENGSKYKGGLVYYDKKEDQYTKYVSTSASLDKSQLVRESRTTFGLSDTFTPQEVKLDSEHHYGWTQTEPEYIEVTLRMEGNLATGEGDGSWNVWKVVFRYDGRKADPMNKVVNVIARDDPGEDNGRTIPEIIIVGGAGLLAAIAAAGNSGDPEKAKKRSRYVMYINKDFGNRLKRGYKTVYVYAECLRCRFRVIARLPSYPKGTSLGRICPKRRSISRSMSF